MDAVVYRYRFGGALDIAEVEATFNLALLSAESLHGESRVYLEARHVFDRESRNCEIDAATEVGRDVNQLFLGFIHREFGREHVHVERLAAKESQITTAA